MPTNGIKYTTGPNETGCLKRGNMLIANNTADYGGSFYSGISPGASGYTIYINKPSGGPSIICPASDSEMIWVTSGLAGASFGTGTSALNWYNTQSDKICVNRDYEQIVINGLVLNLDSGFTPSYPKGGSGWYDLNGSNNGSLVNGPTFNSANGGSIVFDGSDDRTDFSTNVLTNLSNTGISFDSWIYPTSNLSSQQLIIGAWSQSSANDQGGLFIINSGPLIAIGDGNSAENGAGFGTLSLSQWQHVVGTWNPNREYKIYINGVLQGTGTQTGNGYNTTGSSLFRVGAQDQGAARFFNGRISTTKVYNRTLSGSEVLQNYQVMFPRFLGENLVTNGLVLYLDAGYVSSYPGSGSTWFNVSGATATNATLFNSPTYSPSNGGILTFDGTDDYATVPFTTNYPNFTINFFFRLTGTKNYSYAFSTANGNALETFQIEFNDPDAGNTARTLWCWWKSSSGFDGGLYVGSTGTPGSWNDNTWRMLTFTHTGSTNTLYINGVLATFSTAGDQTIPFFGGTNCVISIGRRQATGGQFYQGNLPIVSVYNRVLSPSEVLQNFDAQKSRFGL